MIDFFNHVAFLQFGHAAIGINASDHNAVRIVGQIQLTRDLRSQLVDVNCRQRIVDLTLIRSTARDFAAARDLLSATRLKFDNPEAVL